MFQKNRLRASALMVTFLSVGLLTCQFAHSAATISVINGDGANEGFNDPTPVAPVGGNPGTTLGAQRLRAFQFAADVWGALIDSSVVIEVGATMDSLTCGPTSAVLGAAGPTTVHRDFTGAPLANTWYPQALANSLSGSDQDAATTDIVALFNSAIGTTCSFPNVWYYGLDESPPGGEIDFATVVLHEIGHGLGFLTFVDLASGNKLLGQDDAYMQNLEDHSTGELYPGMTSAERVTASKDTGDLHWVGQQVVDASGFLTSGRHPSGHVEMYAPSPQQPGSSVSHFSTSLAPNELMEPSYTGASHDVGLALELLGDIGWGAEESGCPLTTALANQPDSGSQLDLLRRLRDDVLSDSLAGQRYIRLFYDHGMAVSWILLRNPELRLLTRKLTEHFLPAVQQVVAGKRTTLRRRDLALISFYLRALEPHASGDLRETLQQVRAELRSGKVLQQFGFVVR